MGNENVQTGLKDNHKRSLAAALSSIERLLCDVEAAGAKAKNPSIFARLIPDLSPVQAQVVADSIAQLRSRMEEIVRVLGLPIGEARVPVSRAIETSLLFAQIAIDEASPSRLRGYGEVGAEAAAALEALEADLSRRIARLRTYLHQGLGRDLAARLERLERSPVDLGLLRKLEGVITRRGLIEFRPTFESLLEQIETGTFQIALFGRVNSGKSSLLNAILETDALPVGVTPVTAVPTRITWGETAGARISFAQGPEDEVPLERLGQFVSEEGNPQNTKRVVRVSVHLPSPHLKSGVVLVDTPGLGSLPTSGARESYAYLPRCDLGVVLIDAAGSPTREDLDVLRLLYDSGIQGMAVISRADLVMEQDRERLRGYLREEIARMLGIEPPVDLVSTRGDDSRLARDWFAHQVIPICERAREMGEASARRKFGHLREGVVAALRAARGADEGERAEAERRRKDLEGRASEAERVLKEARVGCESLADRIRKLAGEVIEKAAREWVRMAGEREDGRIGEALSCTIRSICEESSRGIQDELIAARDGLRKVLQDMAQILSIHSIHPEDIQLDLLSRPALQVPDNVESLSERKRKWLPEALELRRTRSRLWRHSEPIEEVLGRYGSMLREWSLAVLDRLSDQFAAQAEPLRSHSGRLAAAGSNVVDREGIEVDLKEIEDRMDSLCQKP